MDQEKPFAITLDVGSSHANNTGAWRTERPVYVDLLPPCNQACPSGQDIQKWLYHAESGDYEQAWRQIMADVFGVPVVGMVEDEGAALGGALQAAWCVARREGKRNAKISDFTEAVVALNEETRCVPIKANVARYRELQAVQDTLSTSLRDSGVFARWRELATG